MTSLRVFVCKTAATETPTIQIHMRMCFQAALTKPQREAVGRVRQLSRAAVAAKSDKMREWAEEQITIKVQQPPCAASLQVLLTSSAASCAT
jgi:hypothetical protein